MPQGSTAPTDTLSLPKFCPRCGWEFKEHYDIFCGGCAKRRDGMPRPEGCGAACKRCSKTVIAPGDRQCAECGSTQ